MPRAGSIQALPGRGDLAGCKPAAPPVSWVKDYIASCILGKDVIGAIAVQVAGCDEVDEPLPTLADLERLFPRPGTVSLVKEEPPVAIAAHDVHRSVTIEVSRRNQEVVDVPAITDHLRCPPVAFAISGVEQQPAGGVAGEQIEGAVAIETLGSRGCFYGKPLGGFFAGHRIFCEGGRGVHRFFGGGSRDGRDQEASG